jgi:hypothetical protein
MLADNIVFSYVGPISKSELSKTQFATELHLQRHVLFMSGEIVRDLWVGAPEEETERLGITQRYSLLQKDGNRNRNHTETVRAL